MMLWKSIVSNPLLKRTSLILFLNKCDILKAKLEAGIQFKRTVLSYGDRPNTFEATSTCELAPRLIPNIAECFFFTDMRKKFGSCVR